MKKLLFNDGWRARFRRGWQPTPYSEVSIPEDFVLSLPRDAELFGGASTGFFPGGCREYVKTFTVDDPSRALYVMFDGVYMNAEVFLNDCPIGANPYGYTGFCLPLNEFLRAGENTLRVVTTVVTPNSRWYSGGGIYRSVFLLEGGSARITPRSLYAETSLEGTSARVRLFASIEGECGGCETRFTLLKDGVALSVTARGREPGAELLLPEPELWSPESPSLYTLRAELLRDGDTVDLDEVAVGLRTVSVSAETGFLVNGREYKLRGGCVHHDNGLLGAASYPRAEERKAELLRKAGFNAVRCAHNPPSSDFLAACDRLGLLVIDEAFDCWRTGKNSNDYHRYFDDRWERDLESMVRRDRTHPSVVIWSIGNEVVEQATPARNGIMRMLADKLRSLDSTRPLTLAMSDGEDDEEILDIMGYNYRLRHYAEDHVRFPRRVMMSTESFPKEAWANWQAVMNNKHIIGDFVWTSMDYLGEAGIGRMIYHDLEKDPGFCGPFPWAKAYCGDIDVCGFRRPQSYYREIVYGTRRGPDIFVRRPREGDYEKAGSSLWGFADSLPFWDFPAWEGKSLLVDVYSAGSSVELFLNGRSLGVKPLSSVSARCDEQLPTDMPAHAALFTVPYEAGELKAVNDLGLVSILRTGGETARISLSPDLSRISAGDICFVSAVLEDEDGQRRPGDERELRFSVSGGRLLALGNSDPLNADFLHSCHKAFEGRLMAVVAGDGGDMQLTVTADGLPAASLVIPSDE